MPPSSAFGLMLDKSRNAMIVGGMFLQQGAAARKGAEQVVHHAAKPAGYTEPRIATRKGWTMDRMTLDRITANPSIMGGKPCVRGTRVTVGTIVGLIAAGYDFDRILGAYPYLEREDISQALSYAAWRAEEREVDLVSS
jgi:uncharacterized protein (DUF433 family)